MYISKKLTAMLLAFILLIACAVPAAIAAPANTGISLSGDKASKTITVQISLPAAGKEASVICMDPSYDYDPTKSIDDWTNHTDKVVALDQVTLDSDGNAVVNVVLGEITGGEYTVLVGVDGNAYYSTFAFQAVPSVVEATLDGTSFIVNKDIIATVKTPANVSKIKLFNESGMNIGLKVVNAIASDNDKIWTVSFRIGSAGTDRMIEIYAYDSAKAVVGFTSVQFDVTLPAAVLTSVSTKSASVAKNTAFDVDVATNVAVKSISFTNTNNLNIGKTLVSKLSSSEGIVWTYSMKLGSVGSARKVFVNMTDRNSIVTEKAGFFTIDITK